MAAPSFSAELLGKQSFNLLHLGGEQRLHLVAMGFHLLVDLGMERLVLCVIASDTVIQLLVKLLPGGGASLEHILTVALEPTTLGARGAELGFSGTVVMTISLP